MFDDITAYFHENILISYLEYTKVKKSGVSGQSKDLRTALNAASALHHLREHIPAQHKKIKKSNIK